MSSKPVAFFDLDNTMIRGGSLYHLARGLQRHKFFSRGEVAAQVWRQLKFIVVGKEISRDTDWIRKATLRFAAGHSVADIEQLAGEIADEAIVPKVYEGTRALAEQHLARGEEVWIITASPVRVANLLAGRLGLSGALGSEAEEVDGRFTGELRGPILHGEHKAAAARAFAREREIDLSLCTAYSDSINDLPLLEAVGHPVVVNGDHRLRAVAKRRGWPTYDFRRSRYARQYGLQALLAGLVAFAAKARLGRRR